MKKRFLQGTALFTALLVLFTSVLYDCSQSVYANESFNGIGNIVAAHNSEDPYTILEIVPDLHLAKLGYLLENQACIYDDVAGKLLTYEEGLAKCTSPSARADYVTQLENDLATIIRDESENDKLLPITKSTYEEKYVAAEGFQKLILNNNLSEVIAAGNASPVIVEQREGGDYKFDRIIDVNDSHSGNYDANIQYYTHNAVESDLDFYYDIKFSPKDFYGAIDEGERGAGYYVESGTSSYLGSQEAINAVTDKYVYYWDSTRSAYVPVLKSSASFGDGKEYLTIQFAYKNREYLDAHPGVMCYQAEDISFDHNGNRTYGAVLDEENPYVANGSGNGDFYSSGEGYRYVGDGNGDCILKEREAGNVEPLDAEIFVGYIYYKGGLTNNNYLEKYVFNQSGLLDQEVNSDFAVNVVTITPGQLSQYSLDDVDMIYISGSSALYSSTPTPYSSGTNDLTAEQANSIYEEVIGNRFLPVILDYSVWGGIEPTTNIGKLAKLLCADELKEENKTFSEDTLTVTGDWSVFSDGDDDKHFVNYNVYVVPDDTRYNLLKKFVNPYLVSQPDSTKNAEFAQAAENKGFGTVASMINMENLYRQTENAALGSDVYGYFDLVINPAINIEYIASYSAKREQYANNTIRVLDIEPCSISTRSKGAIEDKIKGYFGASASNYQFEFTHMTSAQLISKVEDLCNYDMIYMGLYTDTMNKDNTPQHRTIYNDASMNGLVYTNIGDRQYSKVAAGALDNDYKTPSKDREDNNKISISADGNHDVRYSGNDLTEEKQKALISFAKSGCPIILADNFIYTDPAGNTHVYDFEYDASGVAVPANGNGYIDNCSRMYETIDEIRKYNNVMTEGSLSSSSQKEILYSFINLGKPRLTMETVAKVSGQNYVATNGRNVSMDLILANYGSADANATFDCIVYIDFNSDGRFSDTMERLGPNDYGIFLNGEQQEVKSRKNSAGEVEYYYELSPNKSGEKYTLTFNVSSDYYGIIPVKVKVTQSSNPYRYDSKQAYFYRSNTTGTKEKIKVLQILSTGGNYGASAISSGTNPFDMDITAINDDPALGNEVDPYKYLNTGNYPVDCNSLTKRNASQVNKTRITDFKNSKFYELLHSSSDMKDFEIDVDSITGDHFCQYVVNGYPNADQTAADPNNKLNLDDYDMLILGFGDCWTFYPESKSLQQQAYAKIHEFIKSGKSVLFTHDTTSFGSDANNRLQKYVAGGGTSNDWAYYLNPLMCPDVGLDRYGIYSSNILQAGLDGITKNGTDMVTIADYDSLKKALASGEIPSDKVVNGQISEGDLYDLIIQQAKKTQSDIAYEPNSNKQVLTREVQGRSSFNSNRYRDSYKYASSLSMDVNGTPGTSQVATGFHPTNYAELLNEGQILIYPYNLLSEMKDKIGSTVVSDGRFLPISTTHAQYFQIDMNNDDDEDGESDITVWLTLTGESSYYGARNDSRNNYYIYTMGNVTYSGVGHSNINYAGNEAEIKLYINTMITAYRAGIHAPDITIKQDSGMNAATLNTLYVGMDTLLNDDGRIGTETAIDGADGSYEKVYFSVNDTNMVRGGSKTIELSYYLAYNSKEMIPDDLKSKAKNLGTEENPDWVVPYDFRTYLKDGVTLNNSASDEKFVVSGATYCIHVPYSLVEATNDYSAIVRVGATTRLYPKGSTTASAEYTGYKDFHIQRVSLFDLD